MTTVVNLYLVGEQSPNRLPFDASSHHTFDDLKTSVAASFSIARPHSISFHGPTSQLEKLEDFKHQDGDVGVMIDGLPVKSPLGPSGMPFVGNHFEIYPDHMGNHDRLFERYGSVIKTVNIGTTTYLTNDPRVSEVALGESQYFTKTTSDPSHPLHHMADDTALFTCDTSSPAFKTVHKFVPPGMSPKAAQRHVPGMQKAVESCFGVFDELDDKELAFNTYQYMFKLAGQIIYRVVLGLDTAHFASINSPPYEIIRLLGEYLSLMKQTSLSPQWYKWLPYGKVHRIAKVRARLVQLVEQAVTVCEPGGEHGEDMPIQQAAMTATCVADYLKRAVDEQGKKLPHEYLISNLSVLLGAGLNTSSSLLSWLIYALTRYPGNQDRLVQELIDHGADPAKPCATSGWDASQVLALPFLDPFLKETQRMHSPTFQTARNTKQDVIVPGGWRIPAGSVVIPTFPAMHKHKDHWDNPERFDPDRWLDTAAQAARHRMAYTPFAAGPRGCVGFNIAQLEAKMALANLVFRYEFFDASREPVVYDPEFVVIRPVNSYVRAVRRKTWPEKSKS
ncbi:uncharacterized protein E0L32_010994 [Thyridium curvatum]|uniref:Cytochrome P450 n=1 Tax=Thyridium curvatum TaxID=1093900 RepID=A0A507AQF2_9PEZI|nr:uncharacterized protein E0L32_010994 [Thyridium curvatum]TPX07099.1 hypothetical protein E0L32_010994 [Thyridium curvatum]